MKVQKNSSEWLHFINKDKHADAAFTGLNEAAETGLNVP